MTTWTGTAARHGTRHYAGLVWAPLPDNAARGSALCRPRLPLYTISTTDELAEGERWCRDCTAVIQRQQRQRQAA